MRVAVAKQAAKSSGPKKKKARPAAQQARARRSSISGVGEQIARSRGTATAHSARRQSGVSVAFEDDCVISASSLESHKLGQRASATFLSHHGGEAAIHRGWTGDPSATPTSPKIGALSRSRMSQAESVAPSEILSQKPWTKGEQYKIVSMTERVAKSWDEKIKGRGERSKLDKKGKDLTGVVHTLFARDGTSALKRAVSYREKQRSQESKDPHENSLAWFGARDVDAQQAPPELSPDLVEKFVQYRKSEGQQHRQQSSGFFIRVDSKIRTSIDILSLTAVMYCTFMVPFDMVFT